MRRVIKKFRLSPRRRCSQRRPPFARLRKGNQGLDREMQAGMGHLFQELRSSIRAPAARPALASCAAGLGRSSPVRSCTANCGGTPAEQPGPIPQGFSHVAIP